MAQTITNQAKSAASLITNAVRNIVGYINTDTPDGVLVGKNSDERLIFYELGSLTNQEKS